MDWLKGKKTKIGGVAGGLILVLLSLDLINENLATGLLGVVATWTTVSVRMAIKNGG